MVDVDAIIVRKRKKYNFRPGHCYRLNYAPPQKIYIELLIPDL